VEGELNLQGWLRPAGRSHPFFLFADVIMRALANAPYWHPTFPEHWDELREGWSELADDKEWTVWMAPENDK
jgi:hypothetical protein